MTLSSDLVSRICIESGAWLLSSLSGCIVGWRTVAYHFWVTLTFIPDLVLRIIVSGVFLIYHFRKESQIGVWLHLRLAECHVSVFGYCDLDFSF